MKSWEFVVKDCLVCCSFTASSANIIQIFRHALDALASSFNWYNKHERRSCFCVAIFQLKTQNEIHGSKCADSAMLNRSGCLPLIVTWWWFITIPPNNNRQNFRGFIDNNDNNCFDILSYNSMCNYISTWTTLTEHFQSFNAGQFCDRFIHKNSATTFLKSILNSFFFTWIYLPTYFKHSECPWIIYIVLQGASLGNIRFHQTRRLSFIIFSIVLSCKKFVSRAQKKRKIACGMMQVPRRIHYKIRALLCYIYFLFSLI